MHSDLGADGNERVEKVGFYPIDGPIHLTDGRKLRVHSDLGGGRQRANEEVGFCPIGRPTHLTDHEWDRELDLRRWKRNGVAEVP